MTDSLTTYTESNNLLVLCSFKGHKQKYGKSAGKERNAYYLVCDKDNVESEKYYIMEYEKKNKDNEYFKFDINTKKLELYPSNGKLDFIISSIAKKCGYFEFDQTYNCSYYKPLISSGLIN